MLNLFLSHNRLLEKLCETPLPAMPSACLRSWLHRDGSKSYWHVFTHDSGSLAKFQIQAMVYIYIYIQHFWRFFLEFDPMIFFEPILFVDRLGRLAACGGVPAKYQWQPALVTCWHGNDDGEGATQGRLGHMVEKLLQHSEPPMRKTKNVVIAHQGCSC